MDEFLEVRIIEIDEKGRAYGEINGKKIYVKYGIPGDVLKVKPYFIRKGRRGKELWGEIVEIVSSGEGRVEPKCKYFGICGGCRFQDWDYRYQLRYKKNKVLKAFNKFKLDIEITDPIPSPKLWFYRNRMDFPVGYRDGEPIIGLKVYGRWDLVVDLDECHLESEEAIEIIKTVKEFMREYDIKPYDIIKHRGFMRYVVVREGKFTGDRLVSLVTNKGSFIGLDILIERLKELTTGIVWSINPKLTDLSIGEEVIGIYGKDYLNEKIGGIVYYIHPNAFFQTNSYQAEKLVSLAKEYSGGGSTLVDVYSGVGLFSYSLMDRYLEVVSIESDKYSIYSAEINKKNLSADNVVIIEAKAEEYLPKIIGKPDTVIVDPPRPGMSREVKDAILRLEPGEILYFSCNPDSMARDIYILGEKYRIEDKVVPIDMFPHTPHIEVFAKLVLK